MKKREVDWQKLESMSEDVELRILDKFCQEIYDEWQGNTGTAIEIGSDKGKTTAILAQYFDHVLAIDLFGDLNAGMEHQDLIGSRFMKFEDSMRSVNLIEIVHPIISTSVVLDSIRHLGCKLAFVDGDHHKEAEILDIYRVKKHMVEGGYIILHDYKRPGWGHPPYPGEPVHADFDHWHGVAEAVDEFLEQNNSFVLHKHERGVVALKRVWRTK